MVKIVFYRNKCIGCGICFELQPAIWRMSKKDGKANLVKSTAKKDVFILTISSSVLQETLHIARDCPLKIIKIV